MSVPETEVRVPPHWSSRSRRSPPGTRGGMHLIRMRRRA